MKMASIMVSCSQLTKKSDEIIIEHVTELLEKENGWLEAEVILFYLRLLFHFSLIILFYRFHSSVTKRNITRLFSRSVWLLSSI